MILRQISFLKAALVFALVLCASTAFAQIPDQVPTQVPTQAQVQNQGQALTSSAKSAADSSGKAVVKKTQSVKQAVAKKTGLLDINSATLDQLKALPGVSDFAQKIIDARPFKSKLDLIKKKIVPKDIYNQIKSQITAKMPKL